jgi:AcrR family transcriptional regulator
MKLRRPYVMRTRAAMAAATRQRILDAATTELRDRRVTEVRLEEVAARAEVTVQTVLRIFGTRARLVNSAWDETRDRILEQRQTARPGDIAGTIRALYDHYEEMGDFVIRTLADEAHLPSMRGWPMRGRKAHRDSMRRQFGPWLKGRAAGPRNELLDCLVAACDVYTWKLLRRDMGRTRSAAELRVRRMVSAILGGE